MNGRTVPGTTLSSGGQEYVPVSALKAAGFRVSTAGGVLSIANPAMAAPQAGQEPVAGGANQITVLEGCLGQTLFNRVWRVKFSNLRFTDEDGAQWKIDLEMRNATKDMLGGGDSAQVADSLHLSYLYADGTPLAWNISDTLAGQKFTYQQLPPAGVWRSTLSVADGGQASAAHKPTKLVWLVKPSETGVKLPWGTRDPSFRIDLTCNKS
ncbi:hypothetical protein [Deinococcus aerophilus]|uniref:Uncharacterized protein n=1 Tax=Deinococcus aerophilus TaxID=522488 RepID=A0ABQ2GY03_9DEIO|nr:hypothetical protein [Deinococcus aerophilus]GGM17392.1 hypothetical protein GCM10010841_27070 [Deinococcus aerophilus]